MLLSFVIAAMPTLGQHVMLSWRTAGLEHHGPHSEALMPQRAHKPFYQQSTQYRQSPIRQTPGMARPIIYMYIYLADSGRAKSYGNATKARNTADTTTSALPYGFTQADTDVDLPPLTQVFLLHQLHRCFGCPSPVPVAEPSSFGASCV